MRLLDPVKLSDIDFRKEIENAIADIRRRALARQINAQFAEEKIRELTELLKENIVEDERIIEGIENEMYVERSIIRFAAKRFVLDAYKDAIYGLLYGITSGINGLMDMREFIGRIYKINFSLKETGVSKILSKWVQLCEKELQWVDNKIDELDDSTSEIMAQIDDEYFERQYP